jgi:hypothetical protein
MAFNEPQWLHFVTNKQKWSLYSSNVKHDEQNQSDNGLEMPPKTNQNGNKNK